MVSFALCVFAAVGFVAGAFVFASINFVYIFALLCCIFFYIYILRSWMVLLWLFCFGIVICFVFCVLCFSFRFFGFVFGFCFVLILFFVLGWCFNIRLVTTFFFLY